ncbi:hypothetical protein ACFQZX_16545 [Mucilaginibacter litoreus]|uniref:Fimbrillin-A associated anchor protein Mfa1 and Mfa2 n=1 Tax=Mucilaginibacter litoreus TaxID=1048221 RepID=A0ABW3AVY3_9SPHI
MKRFLYFLLLGFTLTACKKNNNTEMNTGKMYKITFGINNFQQSKLKTNALQSNKFTPIFSSDTSITTFKTLRYIVYNQLGKPVRNINQIEGTSGFGTITDSLSQGKYTVVIIAATTYGTPDYNENNPGYIAPIFNVKDLATDNFSYEYKGYDHPSTSVFYETYFKKLTLEVGNDDIAQNLVLDRISGLLEINIEDEIPANAKKISIYLNTVPLYWSVNQSKFLYDIDDDFIKRNYSVTLSDAVKGTKNYKLSIPLPGNINLSTIRISCYDTNNSIMSEKTISKVQISSTQKTLLTGNLFGGAGTNNNSVFTPKADSAWNTTPIVKTF